MLGPRGRDWDACAFSEFMVEEHELRKEKIQEDYNDRYWDQRYTVVQRQIPSFLQKMADKVLSTGEAQGPTHLDTCTSPVPAPGAGWGLVLGCAGLALALALADCTVP